MAKTRTKTGSHLRIEPMGDAVLGVTLLGDPRYPEPDHFRVVLPGGDVDIVRCDNGDYWIHVRANKPEDGQDVDRSMGTITDARLDILGKSRSNPGDFNNPLLHHLAVRLQPEPMTAQQALARVKQWFAPP
jgi:hypothetical protein